MLTQEELHEIKEYVLRELPRVLEEDPRFVYFVEGIVNEKFPTRDEFARLLDEVQQFRKEFVEHSAQTEHRFDRLEQRIDKHDARFDRLDQRLDKHDARFEQIDQRFEQVDQRFEQVDQRFEQVDQRFEQVDQRFEQVDQRFEQVDQRFEQVDHDLKSLKQEMQDTREELNQRIDNTREELGQRIDDVRLDLVQQMSDLRAWVEVIAGGFQDRAGKNLERVVAGAFRLGLERPDIQEEHIRLRQKIYDPTGLIYKPGKQKEVDIIAMDGELLVFEVKTGPKGNDVDDFADKVELVRLQNPDKKVTGIFAALGYRDDVPDECARLGIRLIPSERPSEKKRRLLQER